MPVYTLPCGYIPADRPEELLTEVELVEMTGYEEDILTDKSKMQSGRAGDEVLARCLVRIGDIERPKPGRDLFFVPHLQEMLAADKTFLMIRLRQLSLGSEFFFEAKCSACGHRHPRMRVDLDELAVKPMENPTERSWQVTLPASAKQATIRCLYGKDSNRLRQAVRSGKDHFMSSLLMIRLAELEGQKVTSLAQVKSLSSRDRDFLRSYCFNLEGGIDTSLQLSCDMCGNDWEAVLPMTDQGFFFPSGMQT